MPATIKKPTKKQKATVVGIIESAMTLPDQELEVVIVGLQSRLYDRQHPLKFDEEFSKELHRRSEELESGKVKGIPASQVHRELREWLNAR